VKLFSLYVKEMRQMFFLGEYSYIYIEFLYNTSQI